MRRIAAELAAGAEIADGLINGSAYQPFDTTVTGLCDDGAIGGFGPS